MHFIWWLVLWRPPYLSSVSSRDLSELKNIANISICCLLWPLREILHILIRGYWRSESECRRWKPGIAMSVISWVLLSKPGRPVWNIYQKKKALLKISNIMKWRKWRNIYTGSLSLSMVIKIDSTNLLVRYWTVSFGLNPLMCTIIPAPDQSRLVPLSYDHTDVITTFCASYNQLLNSNMLSIQITLLKICIIHIDITFLKVNYVNYSISMLDCCSVNRILHILTLRV